MNHSWAKDAWETKTGDGGQSGVSHISETTEKPTHKKTKSKDKDKEKEVVVDPTPPAHTVEDGKAPARTESASADEVDS